jgi:hypothetical protein
MVRRIGIYSCATVLAFVTFSYCYGQPRLASTSQQSPAHPANVRVQSWGKLPLSFEKNLGQAPHQADFVAYVRGQSVLISGSGVAFTADHRASAQTGGEDSLRVQLVGADLASRPVPLDLQPGISNYFLGSRDQWITKVPNYSRLKYANVYPGIDVEYYGNGQELEYDLTIAPGIDPGKIVLQLAGNTSADLDLEGSVVATRGAIKLRLNKPVAYQMIGGKKRPVRAHYALVDGKIRFRLGAYDRSRTLVIDPKVVYSTFVPTTLPLFGTLVGVDSNQNAYLMGRDSSGGMVLKLNAAGSALVYNDHFANFDNVAVGGLAVDGSGNAVITGATESSSFATTAGAFQTTCSKCTGSGGPMDGVVMKLDASGNLLYSTFLGGSGNDSPVGVALDGSGNIYVTGNTTSTDFPTSAGAFQTTRGGSLDVFITKLNPGGHGAADLVYSTHLGGNTPVDPLDGAGTGVSGIAVDANGNAYLAGGETTTDFPFNSHVNCIGTEPLDHLYAAKLNGNASQLTYAACLADPLNGVAIRINSVGLDSAGDFYISGSTNSDQFPHVNSIQPAIAGQSDGFVLKLNPAGSAFLFTTYLGGTGDDKLLAAGVDGSQNVYVTGTTTSSDFPVLDPLQRFSGGRTTAWVAKMDTVASKLSYSTFLTSPDGTDEGGQSIAVDGNGNAYVLGFTDGPHFPTTAGALQATFIPPAPNTFLMKIAPTASPTADLSAASLSFGSWGQGVTSAAQTVTLTNNGAAALNISNITASGDFAQTNTCGASLAMQASCSINVTFTATALGPRSGGLTVADDAFLSPQQVQLSGTGVTGPFAALSTSTLSFANQAVGTTSGAQSVALTNRGTSNLTLAISVSGEYAQTNTCPASLPSGQNCSVSVTFSPQGTGFRGGTLTFTDNAADSPQSVALNGDGVTATLNLNVPNGDQSSASVSAGGTATYTLAVGGGGIGGTVNLSCSGAPSAATCSVPATVNANANTAMNFTVTVTTTAASGGLRYPFGLGFRPVWAIAILGLVLIPFSGTRRRRFLAIVPLLLALCSCGGGGGSTTMHNPGTPPGTYTLTVTASSGSANQSMQLTLNVH